MKIKPSPIPLDRVRAKHKAVSVRNDLNWTMPIHRKRRVRERRVALQKARLASWNRACQSLGYARIYLLELKWWFGEIEGWIPLEPATGVEPATSRVQAERSAN